MMDTPPKADPAVYLKLRENALRNIRLNNLTAESVHSVLMDWRINIGIITVLAAADGTASIYLSNGGGYLGGGQKFPKIRQLAIYAVQSTASLFSHFQATETIDQPMAGDVFFYLTTKSEIRLAVAKEADLGSKECPLTPLGAIMQGIITQYRLNFPPPTSK
jgi:hypothetical protein